MFITRKNAPRLKATDTIKVYKIVTVNKSWVANLLRRFPVLVMFVSHVESPYQGMKYEFGKLVRVPLSELTPEESRTLKRIHKGLHCFTDIVAARSQLVQLNDPRAFIVRATLPVGTIYYTNDMFEAVASQIILTDDIVS